MQKVTFPSGTVAYHFGSSLHQLQGVVGGRDVVYLVDSNVLELYTDFFQGKRKLVVPSGEERKSLEMIGELTRQLLDMGAGRSVVLLGVGGGVITDITGFLASVYMRGVRFGFVPTSLLAMTDAAIGGKNGVSIGLRKNIVGTIKQPEFIFYDSAFLKTLPEREWSNGFAEVIKYAAIFDTMLFEELSKKDLVYYMGDEDALQTVITRCVEWKNKTVAEDELEKGSRKLLNFGHTLAHAIEKLYGLSHGAAVGIGMLFACKLSEEYTALPTAVTEQLKEMLIAYGLPTELQIDVPEVIDVLKSDKKRTGAVIDYILLKEAGSAVIHSLPIEAIEKALNTYASSSLSR